MCLRFSFPSSGGTRRVPEGYICILELLEVKIHILGSEITYSGRWAGTRIPGRFLYIWYYLFSRFMCTQYINSRTGSRTVVLEEEH